MPPATPAPGIQWNGQNANALYGAYQNTNDQALRDSMVRDMQGSDNGAAFNAAMRGSGNVLSGGPGGQYSYQGGHMGAPGGGMAQPQGDFGQRAAANIDAQRQRIGDLKGGAQQQPVSSWSSQGNMDPKGMPAQPGQVDRIGSIDPRTGQNASMAEMVGAVNTGIRGPSVNALNARQNGMTSRAYYQPGASPWGQPTTYGNVAAQQGLQK